MDETQLWPALREYWHPVCWSKEATDKPLAVQLLDERIAVCCINGRFRAFRDLCIHRGTPISLGWVEGERIVCAYHGWSYDGAGKCTRIPSVPPEHPIPKKACLTAYPAQEAYGMVWVCLSDTPRAPIPEFPQYDDPGFNIFFRQRKYWKCSAARSIENFVDFGHFAWVHTGILGDRDHPEVPHVEIRREGESLRFGIQQHPDGMHPVLHTRNYRVTRPFTIHQWKVEENGNTEVYLYPVTPHTINESTRYELIGRNYDMDEPEVKHGPVWVEQYDMWMDDENYKGEIPGFAVRSNTIADQDEPIVNNQRPWELPLDLSEELHLKGPDAVAVAYRRFMRELGVDMDAG